MYILWLQFSVRLWNMKTNSWHHQLIHVPNIVAARWFKGEKSTKFNRWEEFNDAETNINILYFPYVAMTLDMKADKLLPSRHTLTLCKPFTSQFDWMQSNLAHAWHKSNFNFLNIHLIWQLLISNFIPNSYYVIRFDNVIKQFS